MGIRPIYHFAPVRGTSETLTFVNRLSISLTEPVPLGTADSPVTSIRVSAVPNQIAANTELEFQQSPGSCTIRRFRTTGTVNVGDRTISIFPYIGPKVPCEWYANTGVEDLTGRVYKAQVKKLKTDTTPYLTLTCSTIPLAGTVSVTCSTTGTEDFNSDFRELPTNPEELQLIDEKDSETGTLIRSHYAPIIEKAWYWDLEYSLNGGPAIADYVGLFWLQAEATA